MRNFFLAALLCVLTTVTNAQVQPAVSVNHFAISVIDLNTSTQFYQNIIGLDTITNPFQDGKHTWFSIGNKAQLHLISGATAPTGPGKMSHICFTIPNMDSFITRLKKFNVAFEDWPGTANAITTRPDGVKQIYFKDPNGWWIEINDAK